MSSILTAVMGDTTQKAITTVQKAKLYDEIKSYAKEDFFSVADMNTFYMSLSRYFISLEMQLTKILAELSGHTHTVVSPSGPTTTSVPLKPFVWKTINIPGTTPMCMYTQTLTPNLKPGIVKLPLTGAFMDNTLTSPLNIIKKIPQIPPALTQSFTGLI